MMKIILFLFVLPLVSNVKCRYQKWSPTIIDMRRNDLIKLVNKLWKEINTTNVNEISSGKETTPEVSMISDFEKFGNILQSNFFNSIDYYLQVPEPIPLWIEVESLLMSIHGRYESFRIFQRQQTTLGEIPSPKQASIDFIETILNYETYSIPQILERISYYIKEGKLFEIILKDMESNTLCISHQSANQLLYNLYNKISLTQIKGYAIIQFSFMLFEMYGKGVYNTEAKLAREIFENRSIETAREMRIVMNKASQHFWRCNPERYERDINYLEITSLLQGYIQNEVCLNSNGTCKENCAYYKHIKSSSCSRNPDLGNLGQCQGYTFNCEFIDSNMWICPANASSGRRYDYVEYENGRILGNKESCSVNKIKLDSWWDSPFSHCSNCMCLCDLQGGSSDRYFSLRQAASNVSANKVVIGIRFTKKNRIIHLQVQQGELLPHGVINESAIEWVPVDDMTIFDRFAYNRQDHFKLDWENRTIDLDDFGGKDSYVLTGIRFKTLGSHLNFEIRVTRFDFQTGTLHRKSSEWLDNCNTEYSSDKRTRISLNNVDVPTKARSPAKIRSSHNQFIEFTHTDFDKDIAQTTVPFLDAQDVVLAIPTPASGAGIYFKSTENSGGFIGLKLITYNFSNHLNATLLEDDDTQEPNSN